MKRVATYEQFLEECGDLNKDLIELIHLRNCLTDFRRQAGVVVDGSDITLQRFDPKTTTVLNEDVITEYNKLIAKHGDKIFSSQQMLKMQTQKKSDVESELNIPLAKDSGEDFSHPENLKRTVFKSNLKQEGGENIRTVRVDVIQPVAINRELDPNLETVEADEFERKFRKELLQLKEARKLESDLENQQVMVQQKNQQMKQNVGEMHKLAGRKITSQKNDTKEPKVISADQAWSNWERFEESIKPQVEDDGQQQTPAKMKKPKNMPNLANINFLE